MADDAVLREVRQIGRELGELIAGIDGRVRRLEGGAGSTQLSRASIENAALRVKDADGNIRQRIGKQPDGRFATSAPTGPPPSVPTAATLEPDTLGLSVTWDGSFVGASRPSDFAYVRVHVSDASGVTGPVAATLSEAGQVTVSPLVVEPKFVVLTAVSTSGAVSDPSAEVSATPLAVVATDLIDGIVDELALADDAVTQAKIAADAVGTAEIQGQAVTLSELADGSVDASKILFDARDIGAVTVFRQDAEPGLVVMATGGTVSDEGGFRYHRFTSSGDLVVTEGGQVEYLVVAGGGGGGGSNNSVRGSGGGGAGGARTGTLALSEGTYSVTIGAAGAGGAAAVGSSGGDSGFAGIVPTGGGGGGFGENGGPHDGLAGGSGGGAGAQSGTGGTGTTGQGNDGGDGPQGTSLERGGGGGGGASAVGGNGQSNDGGPGGDGTEWPSGSGDFYAGGGGGGGGTSGTGGSGVGGDQAAGQGGHAVASTGSGGGGTTGAPSTGGDGSDGVVIVRYPTDPPETPIEGDLWFDTANDNRVSRWDGTAWVATTLGTNAITAGSVTAALIAANTITAQQIAAEAIGADEIAANSVIAGKIAAAAVEAGNIAAQAIQAGNIAADGVQAGNIAADAVTAREILALSVTAAEIAANAITAGKIDAGAVTAEKLAAVLVLASTVLAGDPSAGRVEVGFGTGDMSSMVGIHAIAPDGETITFMLDAVTGEVFLKGRTQFGSGSLLESDYIDLFEQPVGVIAPSLRQGINTNTDTDASSIDVPWSSETQKGNLLLAYVTAQAATTATTPTFVAPADWSLVTSVTDDVAHRRLSLYYIPDAARRSGTETFTFDRLCEERIAGLYEYSGVELLDQSASASGDSNTVSSGTTATTTQAEELWFAVATTTAVSNQEPSNGFSSVGGGAASGLKRTFVAAKNVTVTGQATTSWSLDTSTPWLGLIATFKTKTSTGDPEVPAEVSKVRMYAKERNGETELHTINSGGIVRVLGNDAVFLDDIEFGGTTAAVVFTNIDQNYRDLVVTLRANAVNDPSDFRQLAVRFNGDVGNNYDSMMFQQFENSTQTTVNFDAISSLRVGLMGQDTSNADITIHGYSRTGIKVFRALGYAQDASRKIITEAGGRWDLSDPVTELEIFTFSGDFGAGSGAQLWGVGKIG